ncbi:type II secretion system F family protein [Vibrio sp.]|uniref:Type II secretion system F family protein n=1 Tax=Vibrio viridaestus TaxID=2487322 RepID=A0A3N9TIA1_9VIBR|nr:type II secretion system F family protein [Vibrio viridaestus]MDC0610684.1 type II secretion system F family protein [Vibrio sp.]RQW63810.1 type II secretion system F family protein [Vibrio viridaestus]
MSELSLFFYFHWHGIKFGKHIRGISVERSTEELEVRLQTQQIHLLSVSPCPKWKAKLQRVHLSQKQLFHFIQQLSTLLNADIAILKALTIMNTADQPLALQIILLRIEEQIQSGTTFYSALKYSHPCFQGHLSDVIQVGELSGNLPQSLTQLHNLLEQKNKLKSKMIKAAIYPTFVLLTAFAVTFLMMLFVVPEFIKIYQSMNAKLPALTQSMVDASNFLRSSGYLVVVTILTVIFTLSQIYTKSRSLRNVSISVLIKIPIIGDIMTNADFARTIQTLSTCYRSGISLIESLHMAQQSSKLPKLQLAFEQISNDLQTGLSLTIAISRQNVFPPMLEQMVAVGESSGSLEDVFDRLARDYENKVNNTIDNMGKIIEPIVVLLIGSLVGGIVVAMYLPIFNLMNLMG